MSNTSAATNNLERPPISHPLNPIPSTGPQFPPIFTNPFAPSSSNESNDESITPISTAPSSLLASPASSAMTSQASSSVNSPTRTGRLISPKSKSPASSSNVNNNNRGPAAPAPPPARRAFLSPSLPSLSSALAAADFLNQPGYDDWGFLNEPPRDAKDLWDFGDLSNETDRVSDFAAAAAAADVTTEEGKVTSVHPSLLTLQGGAGSGAGSGSGTNSGGLMAPPSANEAISAAARRVPMP